MAVKQTDVDYAKSTGAYPMPKEPTPLFVDHSDIDFSKSTNAYPMLDESSVNTLTERAVEHIDAPVEAQFTTPGPISGGVEEEVTVQRNDLGLSADRTGESDAGYEARPSSVPVTGADGVDREPQAKVVAAPDERKVRRSRPATGK